MKDEIGYNSMSKEMYGEVKVIEFISIKNKNQKQIIIVCQKK